MFDPVRLFDHYLRQLQHMLTVIEQQAGSALLLARLHEDMLPLLNQVRAAANFALRGCCPFAGQPVVSFDSELDTFNTLQVQIIQTMAHLNALPLTLDNMPTEIAEQAGFKEVRLPAKDFVWLYIVPNFFFHLNMVYAIARHHGVPLSKQDYDGFHGYPSGFSFDI